MTRNRDELPRFIAPLTPRSPQVHFNGSGYNVENNNWSSSPSLPRVDSDNSNFYSPTVIDRNAHDRTRYNSGIAPDERVEGDVVETEPTEKRRESADSDHTLNGAEQPINHQLRSQGPNTEYYAGFANNDGFGYNTSVLRSRSSGQTVQPHSGGIFGRLRERFNNFTADPTALPDTYPLSRRSSYSSSIPPYESSEPPNLFGESIAINADWNERDFYNELQHASIDIHPVSDEDMTDSAGRRKSYTERRKKEKHRIVYHALRESPY